MCDQVITHSTYEQATVTNWRLTRLSLIWKISCVEYIIVRKDERNMTQLLFIVVHEARVIGNIFSTNKPTYQSDKSFTSAFITNIARDNKSIPQVKIQLHI